MVHGCSTLSVCKIWKLRTEFNKFSCSSVWVNEWDQVLRGQEEFKRFWKIKYDPWPDQWRSLKIRHWFLPKCNWRWNVAKNLVPEEWVIGQILPVIILHVRAGHLYATHKCLREIYNCSMILVSLRKHPLPHWLVSSRSVTYLTYLVAEGITPFDTTPFDTTPFEVTSLAFGFSLSSFRGGRVSWV